jgi:D,D-heptose 1,7-bisphosphate phosphatase
MAQRIKAVLLAAGLGTRLQPITHAVPKCLAPIAGRPLLDYWLDLLSEACIQQVLLNTHALADQVRAYIDHINGIGPLHLGETYEPELRGSAGTIAHNASFADDADLVVIIYADNLSDVPLAELIAFHQSHDDPFTMLLFRAQNPRACGIAELDDAHRIVHFEEKPEHPRGDLANAGVYVVDASAYRQIAAMQAFDLGFDVLPSFAGRMRGWSWDGYHRDIGTLKAFDQAQQDALSKLRRTVTFDARRRPAVFLDRDGTIIEQVHYLARPDQVRLLPGVTEALRQLKDHGIAAVGITNQSAIGRGIISEDDLAVIHVELARQLAAEHAALDGIYHCATVPSNGDRAVIEDINRKPGPGMIWRACNELGLDLPRSWMVGDMISDVLAGQNAGCAGSILVGTGKGLSKHEQAAPVQFRIEVDLSAAVRTIIERHLDAGSFGVNQPLRMTHMEETSP